MGFLDIAHLLMANGSDLNARDEMGFTSEFWAD